MEMFSLLLTGGSSHEGLVMWSFQDSFVAIVNNLWNKQFICQWFQTPRLSCDVIVIYHFLINTSCANCSRTFNTVIFLQYTWKLPHTCNSWVSYGLDASYICHPLWYHAYPLQWRHNGCDNVSNQQPHDCLLNCFFKVQIKGNMKAPHRWPL